MTLHARLLLLIGTIVVVALTGVLYLYSPSPGQLSEVHAPFHGIGSQSDCRTCHSENGTEAGCLGCHEEIQGQLDRQHGYHATLAAEGETRCGDCHSEHNGELFALINSRSWRGLDPADFDHSHVAYELHGAHAELECAQCHEEKLEGPFHLPSFPDHPRAQTFLGLEQSCRRCHDDPHAGGLVQSCNECHGQQRFSEPHFDHAQHFLLAGPHADLDCSECHRFPAPGTAPQAHPFPFDRAPPAVCGSCHDSPHRTDFGESCQSCHAVDESIWTMARGSMTVARHAHTGFPLTDAHASLECSACHDPALEFGERHPDPHAPGYARHAQTCEGCHDDPHGGQFVDRHPHCVSCHQSHTFHPVAIDHAMHARHFPLTGAHRAVTCTGCHEEHDDDGIRQFVGTARSCKVCHTDAHAGQFAHTLDGGDCDSCHRDDSSTFSLRPFDHGAFTGHALQGAHQNADCDECHVPQLYRVASQTVEAQRFVGTPTECADCHRDVHRGQFTHHDSCTACHGSFHDWRDIEFDHDRSRFPLEGAHKDVDCARCHRPILQPDGSRVVQYRPLGRQCKDCHEIDPRKDRR